MARCVGPGGSLDVLGLAILEDLKYDKEHDPTAKTSKRKGNRYYGSAFFQDLPKDAEARDPKFYDQRKHWLHCFCAAAICSLVFGILNFLPLFLPLLKFSYDIGALEATVIAASTYAVVFCFGPVASVLIKCMGTRLTCISGQLLLFGGLVLDALEVHYVAYYAAHVVLIGMGSSCAITAAASSVLRHFRKKLVNALIILSIAPPLGTICFHSIYYLLAVKSGMTYKWIMLSIAILVLVSITLTHPMPKSPRKQRHPNPFKKMHEVRDATKDCVDAVGHNYYHSGGGDVDLLESDVEDVDEDYSSEEEIEERRKSCVCVCVLDLSALTDIPFLLWALISSCAMITIYVPCAFLIWNVQLTFNFAVENCLYLILLFCLGSAGGRIAVMMSKNYTFSFNRTVFQVGTAGSALLYTTMNFTSTYGWFLIWCFFCGLFEGFIVGTVPRLTLQTIPRNYVAHCWGYIVFCNGCASILGPYFFMSLRISGDIIVACVAVGVIQFCAAALAIFLPNEYYYDSESDDEVNDPESVPNET